MIHPRLCRSQCCAQLVLLLLVTGCDSGRAPSETAPIAPAAGEQRPGWPEFVDAYIEGYFELFPDEAVEAGRHEFDGQLVDVSPSGIAHMREWLRSREQQAKSYEDSALSAQQRFERDVLLAANAAQLFYTDTSGFLASNPVMYRFFLDPDVYVTREYAPLVSRVQGFIRFTDNLPGFLQQMRANLQPPLARARVEVAMAMYAGMAEFFEGDVRRVFSAVEDAEVLSGFERAVEPAVAALRETRDWLERQLETATDDYALGETRFLAFLQGTEAVEIDLAALKRAGQADLERNLAALREVCAGYAPDAELGECVHRFQAKKPADGPVAAASRQLGVLKEFLLEQDLVTIPSDEEALVAEAPPHNRSNLAYIDRPGPLERDLPSIYYIAPPDPAWSQEQRQAYIPGEAFLLMISVHEVWPGHFLEGLTSNRAPSRVARLFRSYAFSEGWAHYAEEMMLDAGLGAGDPELAIGQLYGALVRNVRYLSAIGLHAEGMSVDESRQMFEDYAFSDPGNAIQQARRGTFDPGYLNYTLGKLMILKLREDWMRMRGEGASLKDFHDTFLSYGAPPVPLLRRMMLGPAYRGDTRLLPEPD